MMHQPGTVTHLLRRLQTGDATALEALMPLLYDELHLAARQRLIKERPGHTLGATALVNEVYLKLVRQKQIEASDKNHFMAIASRTMRNILVDYESRLSSKNLTRLKCISRRQSGYYPKDSVKTTL